MNKSTRLISLLALASASIGAFAADTDGVRIEAKDAGGKSIGIVPVTLDSKIRFTAEGVTVSDKDATIATFPYGNCATLSFILPPSGIEAVEAASPLRLLANPVSSNLEFAGFDGEATSLAVYGLNGEMKLALKQWRGEPVNVSTLTPGLYFVTVNNTTFKFIKK